MAGILTVRSRPAVNTANDMSPAAARAGITLRSQRPAVSPVSRKIVSASALFQPAATEVEPAV